MGYVSLPEGNKDKVSTSDTDNPMIAWRFDWVWVGGPCECFAKYMKCPRPIESSLKDYCLVVNIWKLLACELVYKLGYLPA